MTRGNDTSPFARKVGAIFIPVRDVAKAREWYRDALGLAAGEVVSGHLCVLSMAEGPDLILDVKLTPDGPKGDIRRGDHPLLMFSVDDIESARRSIERAGAALVEYEGRVIQNGHWFNFRDPDGNLLMACA